MSAAGQRGRLITLEGGEGAGKTTQARVIQSWLQERGREVLLTREPGGSPLAEAIRGVVLGDWAEGVPPAAELLLIFAARAAHLHATVLPALEAGQDVVCDRFVDASWAYQGAGRGVAAEHLQALEHLVLGQLVPTLTLVLDVAPEVGLARARGRGDANRFEAEDLDFMHRVRQAYLARAAAVPSRYAVIDAGLPQQDVSGVVLAVLEARL